MFLWLKSRVLHAQLMDSSAKGQYPSVDQLHVRDICDNSDTQTSMAFHYFHFLLLICQPKPVTTYLQEAKVGL